MKIGDFTQLTKNLRSGTHNDELYDGKDTPGVTKKTNAQIAAMEEMRLAQEALQRAQDAMNKANAEAPYESYVVFYTQKTTRKSYNVWKTYCNSVNKVCDTPERAELFQRLKKEQQENKRQKYLITELELLIAEKEDREFGLEQLLDDNGIDYC